MNCQSFIDGEFLRGGERTNSSEVMNPSTGDVLCKVMMCSKDDCLRALDVAHRSFTEWEKSKPSERAKYLVQVASELKKEKESFAKILVKETGVSWKLANAEIKDTIKYFYYMAGWAGKIEGELLPSDRENENILIYKVPVGVVVAIQPFVLPMLMFARNVATALIAGCTIIVKPSIVNPITPFYMTKIFEKIGLPNGVLNLVFAEDREIGELLRSPKVGLISLAGHLETGKDIMRLAAENATKVNMGLGGRIPCVISENVDLDLAVESLKISRILTNGKTGISCERIFVHENIAQQLVDKLLTCLRNLKCGNPIEDQNVEIGPLASEEHLNTVLDLLEKAKRQGAKILHGGKKIDRRGFYFEPTILANVSPDMEIFQQDIHAPILPIVTYRNFEEVLDHINTFDTGRAVTIYSDNLREIMKAANELKYGEVFINRPVLPEIHAFHSGMKQSGIGGFDGKYGLLQFFNHRTVYLQYGNTMTLSA